MRRKLFTEVTWYQCTASTVILTQRKMWFRVKQLTARVKQLTASWNWKFKTCEAGNYLRQAQMSDLELVMEVPAGKAVGSADRH